FLAPGMSPSIPSGGAWRARSGALRRALEGTELGGEAVAHPAHRLDQLVVVLDGQGLAQAADMDVDGALVHVDVAAPDVVEDLVPGVDPVLVGEEEGQQAELRGPHGHLLAGDADVVADGI